MDTLIKLNIKNIIYNSSVSKVKEVFFNLSDFNKLYLSNPLFEFKEYDRIEFGFSCDDSTVSLRIESHFTEHQYGIYDSDDNMLTLKPGEKITLSPGGDSDEMFVPGAYSIQILKDSHCYEGFYNIIPNTLDWQSIINIKEYLESTVKGLAHNIYLEKKANKNSKIHSEQNLDSYRYIYSNQDTILNYLKLIIQNPISDIKKEYVIRDYSKKYDRKSQRWLSRKGGKYNQNTLIPDTFYEQTCYTTSDIPENIILKRMVNYIQNVLIEAEDEYRKILNGLYKNISTLQDKITEINGIIKNASKVSNTYKLNRSRNSEIEILEKEISTYKERIKITQKNINDLYKLKDKINFYINETWLNDINFKLNTPSVTTRLLKNHYYNEIYIIYNRLRNDTVTGGFDLIFPSKKTSKLFEIYSLLITKDIFEDLGFNWTEGWLKSNEAEDIYNGDIASGDFIILEKENYKVIIYYDMYIGTPDELNNITLSQPSTKPDNQHRRPDILVSLYEDNELLGCEIIEVKYRRKSNIFNIEGIDTDVCKQLSSYTGFDYYDAEIGRVRREKPVYKVLTLYPKQDDLGQYKHNTYDIEFIPIMPNEDDTSSYYGKENLRKELEEFLEFFTINNKL